MPQNIQYYLSNANNFAHDILDTKPRSAASTYTPYYQSPSCYHPYYTSPWSFFGPSYSERHVYHHDASTSNSNTCNKSNKSKSNSEALVGALVFTAIAGGFVYSIGSEFSKIENANEDIKKLEQDRRLVQIESEQVKLPQLTQYKMNHIMNTHRAILEDYKSDAQTRLAIKATITTGLALSAFACFKAFFEGALVMSAAPTAIVAGSTAIIVGGLAYAFNAGFSSTSEKVARKAHYLLDQLNQLNA